MIEILETGHDKQIVYLTVDEQETLERLWRVKDCTAVYFDRNEKRIGYHWLLTPVTVAKMKIGVK